MSSSFGFKDDESHASNPNLGPSLPAHQSCYPRARELRVRTPPPGLGQAFRTGNQQLWLEINTEEQEAQDLSSES